MSSSVPLRRCAPRGPAALAAEELPQTETVLPNEIDARRELVTAAFQWRGVPKSAVMAEKRRLFDEARTIDIRIDAPQLIVDPGDADPQSTQTTNRVQLP